MDDTVNLAARLMAAAPPGEMYATAGVLDQARTLFETRALEPFTVRGRTAPVQAYTVDAELGTRPNVADRGLPFAGRTAERAELLGLLDSARAGRGRLVSIVGEQGIGKTRLADELRTAAADLPILEAWGEPYGVGTPYRSVRDTLRLLLGVERGRTEDMAAQLRASVMGIAPSLLPYLPLVGAVVHVDLEETPETATLEHRFRRARLNEVVVELLAAARPGPTVVIVEDAQWMDEATAELLEQLARLTSERPWLICLTRREQPGGFTMDEGSVIELGPLPDDEARRLIAAASEAAPLRTHEVEAIVERAGGSPLYLEELLTIAAGGRRPGGRAPGLPRCGGRRRDRRSPAAARDACCATPPCSAGASGPRSSARSSRTRTSRSTRSPGSSWHITCSRTGTSASCSATACCGTRPTAGSPTAAAVTCTGEPARPSSGWRSPIRRAWPTPSRSTSAWPRTTSGRGATRGWPATAPARPTPTSRRRTTTSGPSTGRSSSVPCPRSRGSRSGRPWATSGSRPGCSTPRWRPSGGPPGWWATTSSRRRPSCSGARGCTSAAAPTPLPSGC